MAPAAEFEKDMNMRSNVLSWTMAVACAGLCCLASLTTPAHATDDPLKPRVTVVRALKVNRDARAGIAQTDAQVHGRLAHLQLNVSCDQADPRALRRAFARSIGVNLIDHFPRTPTNDPATSGISLELQDVNAAEVLKILVDMAGQHGPGAWQVREGIMEMGPRDILARRTAHVTKVYDITDLLIEPPHFISQGIQSAFVGGSPDSIRKKPRELAATIMESIIQSVEPDAWVPPTPSEMADGILNPVDPRDPFMGRQLDPKRHHPITKSLAPLKCQGKWASMILRDKQLVIRAPLFVHIGIEGLPPAVPPPASMVNPNS